MSDAVQLSPIPKKPSLPDETVAELRQKHGAVHQLVHDQDLVVVRMPTRFEFRKWRADTQDERKRIDAIEDLLLLCIVYPDAPALERMLNARPGLVMTFGGDLLELAGVAKESEKKAL